MIKLSIIVPVYNVEKYIRACIESIFRQGLDEEIFEIIIINDGTKDHSMKVISDIVSTHRNITIIEQENQGLSVVRNKGIAIAKGEYVFMPDSDDLIIDNSVKFLLDKALETKADLVVADFIELGYFEADKLDPSSIRQTEGICIEKTGEQMFLEDLSPYQSYVWRILFRRQFLLDNNLSFWPKILFQDVPFIHECYIKANKCIRANWLLNIYRRREGSATFTFNLRKSKDFCTAIGKTWELSQTNNLSPKVLKKLQNDVFTSISVMLWVTSHELKHTSDRIKVIDFLKEKAPDLNLRNGTKQKIFTFMFKRMPHTLIHCRYLYDLILEDRILPLYRQKLKAF